LALATCLAKVRRVDRVSFVDAAAVDAGAAAGLEIVLERVLERRPDQTYPVCVAFKGDSPVEYPFEEDPQDPVPFDLAGVNRRLALMGRTDW